MNQNIKEILEKHRIQTDPKLLGVRDLNAAIIEICEMQKKECADSAMMRHFDGHWKVAKRTEYFQFGADNITVSKESILESNNIAHPKTRNNDKAAD